MVKVGHARSSAGTGCYVRKAQRTGPAKTTYYLKENQSELIVSSYISPQNAKKMLSQRWHQKKKKKRHVKEIQPVLPGIKKNAAGSYLWQTGLLSLPSSTIVAHSDRAHNHTATALVLRTKAAKHQQVKKIHTMLRNCYDHIPQTHAHNVVNALTRNILSVKRPLQCSHTFHLRCRVQRHHVEKKKKTDNASITNCGPRAQARQSVIVETTYSA